MTVRLHLPLPDAHLQAGLEGLLESYGHPALASAAIPLLNRAFDTIHAAIKGGELQLQDEDADEAVADWLEEALLTGGQEGLTALSLLDVTDLLAWLVLHHPSPEPSWEPQEWLLELTERAAVIPLEPLGLALKGDAWLEDVQELLLERLVNTVVADGVELAYGIRPALY